MASIRGELELVSSLLEHGDLTLSEAAKLSGISRSWAWKLVNRLREEGIVVVEKRQGVVLLKPGPSSYRKIMRVGVLRASEYPYIIPFAKRLRRLSSHVDIVVYDEAYRLAHDLAIGRLHLGMAPAVTLLAFNRISNGMVGIVAGGSSGGVGIVEGRGGEGHATTMASTMELCAEKMGLPDPRVYARSGRELLELVASSKLRYGVLWEPYLLKARRLGLRIEPCDLPFCCLLGANYHLRHHAEKIQVLFEEAVYEARRRLDDPVLLDSYARLLGFETVVVAETVHSYKFIDEPPLDALQSLAPLLQRVMLPSWSVRNAIYR